MKPTVKNIIFDLGGIFLSLNYQLTKDAFIALGIKDFDEHFTQHHANDLFERLEKGKISEIDFYDELRQATGLQASNEAIKTAWNAMLLGFIQEKIEWLKAIKQRYNVYLFSNTNQIHYDAFMDLYVRDIGTNDFNTHFIKAYYSQYMGLRKPYPESFQHILDEQNLLAAETLFIDDTEKNIVAANELGLQTILLLPPTTVLDLNL
jgi:glucose-1-phosphatase